ncbi:MAG TPA: aldehyde dehydrogenase family protein [Thermoanaerobaculia bacterium]|nr:aldehyde dehydrogenase family protein [Thermoanaerobaculia bacterium]
MSLEELVVTAPFGGLELARVASPSAEDIEAAVRRAVLAFEKTRVIPTFTRVAILRTVAAELERRRDDLARTIAAEAGKPLKAARAEAERAAATFSATAAALEAQKGEMLPLDVNAASLGRWGVVKRVPLGPVLAITPFNFPLNLTSHKVAPAIAVGAPVVQKPASKTPLSALALREIVLAAGWPADAYAVLPISGEAAEGLVTDPRLPVVSFTGSGAVGWRLKSLVPKKRVALELGGNAAVVVHSDADLDDAARRTASGAFSYAGQSCISVQRALVHRPVLEAFREKLLAAASTLVVGDPLDEKTDVGPMIAPAEAARVEAWVAEAVAGGATVLRGGTRIGECLHPTILANTTPSMKVEGQEVFAPVVTLNAYDDFEEALRRVNDSKYGLQAGVFTRDLARIQRAFDVLEVGAVLANDVPTWRADRMPYGGVKESGSGREGPAYAMEEFTEPRLLVIRS